MFSVLGKTHVGCVILNACFSRVQAEEIVKHVQVVVGMSNEIRDSDAIAFSGAFHQGLACGEDVAGSFVLACNAIGIDRDAGVRAADAQRDIVTSGSGTERSVTQIPQLLVRSGVDASALRFSKRRRSDVQQ